MKRVALYSRARPLSPGAHRRAAARAPVAGNAVAVPPAAAAAPPSSASTPALRGRMRERAVLLVLGALLAVLGIVALHTVTPVSRAPSVNAVREAIGQALDDPLRRSPTIRAYGVIAPSVVRVRAFGRARGEEGGARSVGSGVVIVDHGIILTNLHVVEGARRVQVIFAEGLTSAAEVVGVRPDQDLAILRAEQIPDDLVAATLRSTADLAVGEQVVAVGFPFDVGPTATAGVISGLGREFVSPDGGQTLTNLIQFDAAANPGSSGGPLVTLDGEVVGIVTGILNPTDEGFFVGIGFAVPIENAAAAAGVPPF